MIVHETPWAVLSIFDFGFEYDRTCMYRYDARYMYMVTLNGWREEYCKYRTVA